MWATWTRAVLQMYRAIVPGWPGKPHTRWHFCSPEPQWLKYISSHEWNNYVAFPNRASRMPCFVRGTVFCWPGYLFLYAASDVQKRSGFHVPTPEKVDHLRRVNHGGSYCRIAASRRITACELSSLNLSWERETPARNHSGFRARFYVFIFLSADGWTMEKPSAEISGDPPLFPCSRSLFLMLLLCRRAGTDLISLDFC